MKSSRAAIRYAKALIQESIEVALSVAWNKLDDSIKKHWTEHWKEHCEGFHVHCPEGAVPKDGPSAGTALSLAFYSLLSKQSIPNTISITGEILDLSDGEAYTIAAFGPITANDGGLNESMAIDNAIKNLGGKTAAELAKILDANGIK